MTKLALYVALEAKPGKEAQLADFLISALPMVEAEQDTTVWFAMQMGPSTFGIFDAFLDEKGREAHLFGEVAKALMAKRRNCWPRLRRSKRSTLWPTSSPLILHGANWGDAHRARKTGLWEFLGADECSAALKFAFNDQKSSEAEKSRLHSPIQL